MPDYRTLVNYRETGHSYAILWVTTQQLFTLQFIPIAQQIYQTSSQSVRRNALGISHISPKTAPDLTATMHCSRQRPTCMWKSEPNKHEGHLSTDRQTDRPRENAVSVDFSRLTSCWFTTLISFFPTSGRLSICSTHRLGTYLCTHTYRQCCVLKTSRQHSRVHFTKVSVSRPWCQGLLGLGLERAEWQGLIRNRMQQILRKCSDYSKNRIHTKTSGLWEYGHGQQFVGSVKCTVLLVSNWLAF